MTKPPSGLQIFRGLKALSEAAFPKQCRSCGRSYDSAQSFIHETRPVREGVSGLKCIQDECDNTILELFRNCPCGSTLMDFFDDRRDTSPQGLKRRELFGQLMQKLQQMGLSEDLARAELLKILRGEASDLLASMGIKTVVR